MYFQYIFRKYVQNGLTLIAFVCDHMIIVCVQMKYSIFLKITRTPNFFDIPFDV
jgi:20S proteasome alpha/beta subunit